MLTNGNVDCCVIRQEQIKLQQEGEKKFAFKEQFPWEITRRASWTDIKSFQSTEHSSIANININNIQDRHTC